MTLIRQIRDDYLERLELAWPLDRTARRRLLLLCSLPAFIVAAQLIKVALAYVFGPYALTYPDEFPGGASEVWQRLFRFTAFAVEALLPVTVGVLFLGGILVSTRVQASWVFAAGTVLASAALLLGLLATVVYTLTEDTELISDIGADLWLDVAQTFGLLSIGFFFVAFRALSGDSHEEAVRTEVPAETPSADSDE